MSTDDLTARARAAARDGEYDTSALLSELADEVDRLRESALDSRLNIEGLEVELCEAKTERDAARAALERVRGVATNTSGRHPSTRILNPQDILNALEGES